MVKSKISGIKISGFNFVSTIYYSSEIGQVS